MNKYSFGYEDTDKKIIIELYGIEFELKGITIENLVNYEKLDNKDIKVMEKSLEEVLGIGAIEKLNNKRIADGYGKMPIDVITTIWSLIFKTYSQSMSNQAYNTMTDTINGINNRFNKRNYAKNYNRKGNRY